MKCWNLDYPLKPRTLHRETTPGNSLACMGYSTEADLVCETPISRLRLETKEVETGGFTRCQNNAPTQGAAAIGAFISFESFFCLCTVFSRNGRVDKR